METSTVADASVPDPESEVTMFDHQCTACEKRQLIFPSMVTAMSNTDHGIVVDFTCWCGADQTMVTGKKAGTERKVVLAA